MMTTAQRELEPGTRRMDPITTGLNLVVWVSSVIVMGILAYLVSLNNNQGSHVIYELTIAVLTVVFYLAAFFLPVHFGLLFNIIFSHLWIVAVAFTASDWTYSNSALLHAAEAFSFIAFFFLFFNLLHNWYFGSYSGRTAGTSHV
ncbi:uncharacterized protein B0I36DRAFT_371187 [Microdochium trichocladiopsis]|uniref:MARVEL domain-containing protein n=1 Tax=Microdochium trichocladiopsis TaxID=1682393 RepID=A0A9P8YIH0_9PEZI|nr:uncharacterized protein B0I36DRAFT_371187 [Microdochium trichocladiopsis]KAH7040612.1 hypothetical protein B0I36DRAFT_371187 [Microdochium trichocladiopsis]